MHIDSRETTSDGRSGMIESSRKVLKDILSQVALRRQQAQEEAEARQLGVEILKPGDRAELVMGGDMVRHDNDPDTDTEQDKPDTADGDDYVQEKKIKIDTSDDCNDQGRNF